jgi:UDP-2,3-diacylglucosamine pyrophosphatase LpxH
VDFLAEADPENTWSAFTADQAAAVRKLDAIVDRDPDVFQALGDVLGRGHRVTLLLGNHDIELALPAVRRRLMERLGIDGRHDFNFIYDGEAYVVGRALIEHGNRYDSFNVVDYDALRRVRSLLSRNQPVPDEYVFPPPAGSYMVAQVINPIKREYRLIDLLKPETGAALPILMALEPGYRSVLTRVAELSLRARQHRLESASLPSFAGDISATSRDTFTFAEDISAPAAAAPDALDMVVRATLKEQTDLVLRIPAAAAGESSFAGDISARDVIDRTWGLARMLLSTDRSPLESRLPALLAAVRCLQNDRSFARDEECFPEYLDAAKDLAGRGFDYVVFGHTHLARDVAIPGGARYLNSGTWADLIRFPAEILAGSTQQALEGLRAFVEDMGAGRLHAWTAFVPTYVKLTLGADGAVRDVALKDYAPGALV